VQATTITAALHRLPAARARDAGGFSSRSHPVERLVGERQGDGGWNCERADGSVRSSFHSTINVLEGLLECEKATGGTPECREARRSGEEYLLKRKLFRRLSTGEPAVERFLLFLHPSRWRYDILRALDYFPLLRDADRRRSRSAAHRRDRPRSFRTLGGGYLAPRPAPFGAGVVRGRRRARQALAMGDSPRDASAQMVGKLAPIGETPAKRRCL
jgi:hypothetical protein